MINTKILLISLILIISQTSLEKELWRLFEKTSFIEKYNRTYSTYFLYPKFPKELLALEGKQVTIKGFYIPLDWEENAIVISKYPMAECFFCGGAGQESIALAYLQKSPGRLKTDQIITVQGTLHLNNTDVDDLNFIIKNAKIIYE
ncbi:hypothetical protein KIH41_10520 [Litoribacter ruber]|uniref:hypothetical protein n=1 Tax=Litoribacter ruber TaxID=702568 RepID=UPI001BDB3BDA|nr:hypothetical protein [Litoribacter ruber]MBT0811710.1 hypothetical protein [Litoribacter ruber]